MTTEDRSAEDLAIVEAASKACGLPFECILVGVSPHDARNRDARKVFVRVALKRWLHPLFFVRRAKMERAVRALVGPETVIEIEAKVAG